MTSHRLQALTQCRNDGTRVHGEPDLRCADLRADMSRLAMPASAQAMMQALVADRALDQAIKDLLGGEALNITEDRPALHSALRGLPVDTPIARSAYEEAKAARETMLRFTESLRSGELVGLTGKPIRDFVNIGIGGSDLGPRLIVDALDDGSGPVRTHFLANVDGHAMARLLRQLNPETTLFCVVSKSFGTRETLLNATTLRRWLAESLAVSERKAGRQFIAVSANVEKALDFGIDSEHIFPMFDWVGGRYSLWSNVGIAIAVALGREAFEELLEGAANVDHHFATTPHHQNLPVQMALWGVWQRNGLGAQLYTVVSYDDRLALLGDYLQQLDMESNGKRVDREGKPCKYATGPAVLGGVGTVGQHSYFQWLHQGTDSIPIDLIGVATPDHSFGEHHQELLSNYAGQAWALSAGRDAAATAEAVSDPDLVPHCTFPGHRQVTTITLPGLTPRSLGALLAAYEHKVFVQGWLWNINSFDQFGVELGKVLAKRVMPWIEGAPDTEADATTRRLLGTLAGRD